MELFYADDLVLIAETKEMLLVKVERKSGDDWVSACRNVVMAGVRGPGRGRKTWHECVKKDRYEGAWFVC